MTGSQKKASPLKIWAGCFAVFTICYAIFDLISGYAGLQFNKSDQTYWMILLAAYVAVNVIAWPIVKKYVK